MASQLQIDEIKGRLDKGMEPEDIANSLGRIADLDLIQIAKVRNLAQSLARGEVVEPSDPI